ncbi:MAG: hypothetical protein FJ125_12015, partial [Deltaproteobacteria bacterium]|nr:hypothetical protein [Deltaproteobacteria bacterium]
MGKLPPEAPEPCLRPRTCTWLAALLAVGVALSRLPALLLGAAAEQPPERVFLGFEGDAAGVVDLHYYASYVEEARARPKLLLTDRATTEPQRGRVISLYFSALGLFVRGSGLSVPAAWNIAKILVILLFFFVLWQVLGLFFASAGQRLLAFALVAVGGGFGWLLLGLQELAGNDGGTWYLADLEKDGAIGYSTFGYLFHPQALLAQTCFLAALLLWARWRAGRGMRWLAAALICAILVFMIHGPSSPVFYLALLAAPAIPLFFR